MMIMEWRVTLITKDGHEVTSTYRDATDRAAAIAHIIAYAAAGHTFRVSFERG